MKNVSVRIKLFALVCVVVVISFLSVSLLVSNRSIASAKEEAFKLADEMAEKYKNEILTELRGARVTSETLKSVLETLKDYGITDRDMINDMLIKALEQKEYITAFCVAYEPNMLDGQDDLYAGVGPAYDETGRFAPYWNKLGGNIAVEPLSDIDAQDWYIVPKERKAEYITDPYSFHVQGQDVMLASFVFPILHEGGFIGIIASDIVLDSLQAMIAQADAYGKGIYAEIFSSTGAVVAHPDKTYHGKSIAQTLMYNMMIYHPDRSGKAISAAEKYIREGLGADAQEEENALAFLESLRAYEKDPNAGLDITCLTPGMADEILRIDPSRWQYAFDVSAAIKNGEDYVIVDEHEYTVYMPIRFSESTRPWSVAVSIPMASVQEVSNNMRGYVLGVCAVSVVVIACIIYLISKNITSPILALARTAEELGTGNLNTHVPLIESSKEIAVLSGALRAMAEKIEELVNKLQNNAKVLEAQNDHLNILNEMLIATNHVAETIMNVEHQMFQDVLDQAIRIIGKSANARAVSIWQNATYPDGKTYGRRISAWTTGRPKDIASIGTAIDLDRVIPGWKQAGKGKDKTAGVILDGSGFAKEHEGEGGGGAAFFIPLVLHETCWGFLFFSFEEEEKHLQGDEHEILRSGGMMIASAILQNQFAEDLEQAEEKAATDSLTGLTNRNGFLFKASAIYTACREGRKPLTLLFFDLDHFKQVNDRYGHPFGDEVLKAFAGIVRDETGAADVCCRYGGEEFILLLNDCDSALGWETADRILEAVRNMRYPEKPELTLTVSIGMVSAVPGKQDSLNGYIQKADSALYLAKRNGRNRVMLSAE